MRFIEKLELIERVAYLIEHRATGSPEELAVRLKISKRHVHNVIQEMKELGGPIDYDTRRKSYYYTSKVKFASGFLKEEKGSLIYTLNSNKQKKNEQI